MAIEGGGSRSKFWSEVILVANFVYFYLLFAELKNLAPLAHNCRICRGCQGPWGIILGLLERFDKQRVKKVSKSIRKHTSIIF